MYAGGIIYLRAVILPLYHLIFKRIISRLFHEVLCNRGYELFVRDIVLKWNVRQVYSYY